MVYCRGGIWNGNEKAGALKKYMCVGLCCFWESRDFLKEYENRFSATERSDTRWGFEAPFGSKYGKAISEQLKGVFSCRPRKRKLQVREVKDGTEVKPNAVYIVPSNRNLAILNGFRQLLEPSKHSDPRLSIDYFFRSLAQDKKTQATYFP